MFWRTIKQNSRGVKMTLQIRLTWSLAEERLSNSSSFLSAICYKSMKRWMMSIMLVYRLVKIKTLTGYIKE